MNREDLYLQILNIMKLMILSIIQTEPAIEQAPEIVDVKEEEEEEEEDNNEATSHARGCNCFKDRQGNCSITYYSD